jgi:hypothetical protein
MKTNTGQNRCATIGSTTCMKYTGYAIPELDIYCDDDLNEVLNIIFVRLTEVLKTKGLDLSDIQPKCIDITNADKTSIVTVINKIIDKVCELELVASGEQTINTVKVVLNTIPNDFWSSCIEKYLEINDCSIETVTLYDLLKHINSEICRNISDLTDRIDTLETNSLRNDSTEFVNVKSAVTQLQADVTSLESSLITVESDYSPLTIQSTTPSNVGEAVTMLISAVDKIKTELFSSSAGISNITYEPDSTLVTNLSAAHVKNGGNTGDIIFNTNIEESIETLMRVIIQMNNVCKLLAVSAFVSGRVTAGGSAGAPTGIKIQLVNYTTATPVIAKIDSGGNLTDNLPSTYNSNTGIISLPSNDNTGAYTTITSTDRIRITQGSCVAFINAPDMTRITIPAS